RWSGSLNTFYRFRPLVAELESFLSNRRPHSTLIYQNEVGDGLSFEFNQDAIIDGKFLHSQTDDPHKITHPKFFKNLVRTCVPLDYFFQIETIRNDNEDQYDARDVAPGLLGVQIRKDKRYPLALIVDYSSPNNVRLELIDSNMLKAKSEKYGTALFQYFGLIPKKDNININIFREFFLTNIGRQIVQLSLNGTYTKTKARLSALLIPQFFSNTKTLDLLPHQEGQLSYLRQGCEALLQGHPQELADKLNDLDPLLGEWSKEYPWHLLCELSQFKYNIENAILEQTLGNNGKNGSAQFSNPLILGPLLKSNLKPIYPQNQDIYVDFKIADPHDIHLPLTKALSKRDEQNHYLELFSHDRPIIRLYSTLNITSFIKYLLDNSTNIPVSKLLQKIQIPTAENLDLILHNFKQMEDTLGQLKGKVTEQINRIITQQISLGN
ncbi:MAG: hypothetical protein WCG27_01195, partial [Pseudomonadota bacterium]